MSIWNVLSLIGVVVFLGGAFLKASWGKKTLIMATGIILAIGAGSLPNPLSEEVKGYNGGLALFLIGTFFAAFTPNKAGFLQYVGFIIGGGIATIGVFGIFDTIFLFRIGVSANSAMAYAASFSIFIDAVMVALLFAKMRHSMLGVMIAVILSMGGVCLLTAAIAGH